MNERGKRPRQAVERAGPSAGDLKVERALLSVSDKRGLVDFARALSELGVEIVSTGGTAAELERAGHRDPPDRGLHGLSRDPRRPRQDASPRDLRRPAGDPLEARSTARRSPSTASSRSTSSASTSIRSSAPPRGEASARKR